ncbi:hypothetical protein [Streptomyces salinarius]|uniref:hypothetical protein n=1 Tax=Streptomyces salinarius TaxID=2762598 RepID=UPI00164625F3|nr:hypothetical protein [Streptomyces salinarius]
MSLSTLRAMNFTALSDTDAAEATGSGLSKAQCAEIWALAQAGSIGYGCAGGYNEYMDIYNRSCK